MTKLSDVEDATSMERGAFEKHVSNCIIGSASPDSQNEEVPLGSKQYFLNTDWLVFYLVQGQHTLHLTLRRSIRIFSVYTIRDIEKAICFQVNLHREPGPGPL